MPKLTETKYLNLKIATAFTAGFSFLIIPQFAKAAPFDQPPLPTFSPVTSTDAVTSATIPANLVKQWRGVYSRPALFMLTNTFDTTNKNISKISLREYLLETINGQPIKEAIVSYKFDPGAVYDWTKTIAESVNAVASEPAMTIDGDRVTDFTPPQTGKAMDRYNSTLKIINALSQGQTTVNLVVYVTQPKTSLASLNNLGINEIIGRGESKYTTSPANRKWNIKVGVQKMTGIIIKPGDEFSFDKYLGPVDGSTGYKPELVIKGDQGTIPEFGGGLCQVSSTTFRAAMHAGLPITERRNHSYAVSYYAPQGTDATIYPGAVDLKFINDTGHSILIWPHIENGDYLIFDFYGTYDGRKVVLHTPYSYDHKSDGSLKATWARTVTLPGKAPREDVFNSDYQPPALFHKPPAGTVSPGTTGTDANGVTRVLAPPVDPASIL